MKKGGYGLVYQNVMRSEELTPEAKAIYAYLSSMAGNKDECYPSRDLMAKELAMSKNRLDKHLSILVASGVVEKTRENAGNLKGRNIYKITHETQVRRELKNIFRYLDNKELENKGIENKYLENEYPNNNSLNNNRLNNNSINYQQIADLYNEICISFPRLTKLSDSRKKAIKARLKQYSIEDFRKLFIMAEESSFLKGKNSGNWSANFDWLVKDANMAKVLDGNYEDKKGGDASGTNNQSWDSAAEYYYKKYLMDDDADKKGGDASGTDNQSRGQAADFYKRFLGIGDSD
ncbi:MAG: helix-turn-helix domain-containing protein [Roseburia sp.]|nr:helix-turn-helix domain-containing protein [Roseburia sp.]